MLAHLNSRILPLSDARISPLDRGFLFGDALYEGLRAFDGHIAGLDLHIDRLRAGLHEIDLDWDASRLAPLSHELLNANKFGNAFLYWQISRGAPAPGQHPRARLLKGPISPTVFGLSYATPSLDECRRTIPTKSAITVADDRWARCHVKTTSLLGAILATLKADHEHVDDAIFIRDSLVAESTSANLFAIIPSPSGPPEIVTPSPGSAPLLAGVTRAILLEAARRGEIPVSERPVRAEELARASEVFLCGTLTMVTAITRLDGRTIGDGSPGPVTRRLHDLLIDALRAGA